MSYSGKMLFEGMSAKNYGYAGVSEWFLFIQLYHDENKLIFNELMMRSSLY
jgi:hypothetical protein